MIQLTMLPGLHVRRVALTLLAMLVWAPASGAQPTDAQSVLKRADEAHRNLKTYDLRALVLTQTLAADAEQTVQSELTVVVEQPRRFRIEATGPGAIMLVSDGSDTWVYQVPSNRYTKNPSSALIDFALTTSRARMVLFAIAPGESVRSARFLGEDELTLNGAPHPCYVIEAELERRLVIRDIEEKPSRFWIDKSTYLVLKRTAERRLRHTLVTDIRTTATIVSVQAGAPPVAELFRFRPPATATEFHDVHYQRPDTSPAGANPFTSGPLLAGELYSKGTNGVTEPIVVSKREPEYTDSALRARVQRSIVLEIIVSPDGIPAAIRVFRGLGYGLDESAVKAVSTWKFRPAMKEGKPVTVRANIEVAFRLP